MMVVMMINTKYSIGGAAVFANTLHKFLNNNGQKCLYFYGRGFKSGDDTAAREDPGAFRASCRVTILANFIWSKLCGTSIFSSVRGMRELHESLQSVDLIHIHNIHGYVWNHESILRALPKEKPIVWTFHDIWPVTGRCALPYDCRGFEQGCVKCPDLSNYPSSLLDHSRKNLIKKAKFYKHLNITIVSPSEFMANEVFKASHYYFPRKPIVINNGVDIKIFRPRYSFLRGSEKKKVLFVAEDCQNPVKGARSLLALVDQMGKGYEFTVVGRPINELLKHPVSNVFQVGYISDKEALAELYSAHDVYLMTSIYENYPTTVLESLACGTPVAAFAVGGIPELVEEGKTGYLAPKGNIDYLIKCVRKASELGRVTSRIVRSVESVAEDYMNLYRGIMCV